MSYYSSIAGRARMTREAFERFSNETVTLSDGTKIPVDIGRWCYVAAEPPPPPKAKEAWYYVEDCK